MRPTSNPIYRWRVGEIEIARVLEFEAALFEPTMLYPEATHEIIERHRNWLEPTLMDPASGLLSFAFHSTVIKTPRATILVDTCSGNDKERPHKLRYHRKNWPYLANLAAAGFAPENIDYVLCTHLHADHVGWNTRLIDGRWTPTFPNARYLFARQEWEHWRVAELRAEYTTIRRCSARSHSSTAAFVSMGRRREQPGAVSSRPSPIPPSCLFRLTSRPRRPVGYDRVTDRFDSISTPGEAASMARSPDLGKAQNLAPARLNGLLLISSRGRSVTW